MFPDQANFTDLAARIAKLEVQNRRWKLAASLLGLVGLSFVILGAKPVERFDPPVVRARVVEAEEFQLKDDNGHVYARLSLNPEKKRQDQPALGKVSPAVLEFYDENGDVVSTVPVMGGFLPVK